MVWARISPVLLTTVCMTWSSPLAVRVTKPPSAMMACLFSTSALSVPRSTVTPTSELPLKLSETLSPAASTAVPRVALITPSLATCWPSSAMCPALAAVSVPKLMTLPREPLDSKVVLPAMKSASLMFSVLATKPPTFTWALRLNKTPLALRM